MRHEPIWLNSDQFAAAHGISPQAARKALKRAISGALWRGQPLEIRESLGRGGRHGISYEALAPPSPAPRRDESDFRRVSPGAATARWTLIAPALAKPRGSPSRAAEVEACAAAAGVALRTLYRWIDRYEQEGARGLTRRRSPSAATKRVAVSRPFDAALLGAGHPVEMLDQLAGELDLILKSLWASRAERAGVMEIRRLAEFRLRELCDERGLSLPKTVMRLSRRRVERFANFRVVNQRRNDSKAFDDAKPRVRRDWTMLAPMERIVADVKHLDVIVTRDDGSTAWPKIVAFMDAGTGRVLVHPVLLDAGEGVRQEHVIEAFLAMVSDPAWGFPQGLYLDNGSEFAALAKIDSALRLLNAPQARTLIFARPYNAAAKPIESVFSRLDRYVFSMMPGYAGPNRMAQKTQTVGKPPKAFPGSWAEFCRILTGLIQTYNQRPVGGLWRGRSPNEWFDEKRASGWSPALVDPSELDAAFCDHDSRRVDRGILRIGGKRYTHPAVSALPGGTTVDIALPWRRGAPPLAKADAQWVQLELEVPYPAHWIEGAREASRRQSSQNRHVTRLRQETLPIDPVALKLRSVEARPPTVPPMRRLDLGSDLQEKAIASSPRPAEISPADLRRARDAALTERLEREQQRDL